MCVIMASNKKPIPPDMIAKGYEANPHGAGIAWRDGGMVRWVKGLEMDDIQKLAAKVPFPYVVHFRVPTVGGSSELLTHPFPIQRDVSLALEGKTKGYVLFHNGHWTSWKNDVKEAAIKRGIPLPVGKWSDSRGLAFVSLAYGLGILEFIDEKVLAFGAHRAEVFGAPWSYVNDIWCSNRNWEGKSGNSWFRRGTGEDKSSETVQSAYNDESDKKPNISVGLIEEAKAIAARRQAQEKAAKESAGGAPQESPFAKAHRELREAQDLFAQNQPGKILMSKNKLKKFQRAVDVEARKEAIRVRSAQQTTTLH